MAELQAAGVQVQHCGCDDAQGRGDEGGDWLAAKEHLIYGWASWYMVGLRLDGTCIVPVWIGIVCSIFLWAHVVRIIFPMSAGKGGIHKSPTAGQA